jgi:6-phosphogluconolactonase (cycloisomerase 2 family)
MRMKFNKSGQLALVSAASLLVAGLLTACSTLTVDFVYVASSRAAGSNNYGEIDVMEVNSESGFMRPIPTSPFPSGGRNPVAEAVSADFNNLYVVNRDDNTIVQFAIGNDGKLYPQNTVNTPGVFPIATAAANGNLFVADTYQPLPTCSPAAPCSGSVAVYPIAASSSSSPGGKLGSPVANGDLNYWALNLPGKPSDVVVPTSIDAFGAYVFVSAYDSTASPTVGYIFGFSVASGGSLTPLNNGTPFAVGLYPSSITHDPTGQYVYVTDFDRGEVYGFTNGSGLLSPLHGSPFQAGNQPSAMAVDPAGTYAFVANAQDATITAYSVSAGELTRVGSYATSTQPVAIIIDPSTNHFIYTANFLGASVSGYELTSTGGTLIVTQNTPYTTNAQPTAMAAIPHGGMAKK